MKKILFSFLFLSAISLCACSTPSYAPFTFEHRLLFDGNLHKIQYYINQEVRLRRNLKIEERIVEDRTHRIRIERNRKILEITVPQYTPGILDRIEGDTLYIRFENIPDGLDRTIPFFHAKDAKGDRYEFRADSIEYGGETFEIFLTKQDVPVSKQDVAVYVGKSAETAEHQIRKHARPMLLIDLLEKNCREEESRRVRGVKVKN